MISIKATKKITAILISVLMCFCVCACGENGPVEETVEITTPAEGAETPADTGSKSDDSESKDKSDSKKSDDSDEKADSQYEQIYKDCKAEMKEATKKYVGELEDKADSVSKSKLYDETQDRIKALGEIYDKGKDKMVDAMLKSTEDDEKEYKKYFDKMTEEYTELSREITSVYMDEF